MTHPNPQYELVARELDNAEIGYQFPNAMSREPAIRVPNGPLNPTLDSRIDRVPEPVQIRTPATIHYPRARDVVIVNSGANINEQKIGFDCRAIVVQNVGTNGFLYCPELNLYLTSGATPLATFNLPSSVEKLSFVWHTAAFNTATPGAVAGQFATVWLYDEWVLPAESAAGGGGGSASSATASTGTQSNVAQNVASVQALALNTSRKGASFFNDTGANAFLSYSGAASATNFKVELAAGAYYEMEPQAVYTGIVTVLWDAAGAGALRVTELS